MAKQTYHFVIGSERVEIELDRASLPQPAHPDGYISFTGAYEGGAGQIVTRLSEATDDTRVQRLCELWNAHHMKDDSPAVDEVVALLESLDGERIDTPDVSADLDYAEFSNADDVIDSRQITSRIEYLTDYVTENPTNIDAVDELKVLKALESEAEGYSGDWQYGATLIRDSYFEDYARELAEDIGASILGEVAMTVYILFHETNTGDSESSDGYVDGVYASEADAERAKLAAIHDAIAEGRAVYWNPDTEEEDLEWSDDWRVEAHTVLL